MTLGKLFPQHEPSRKVPDPVFLGGPMDLYLAIDSHVVDRVIEKQASEARFLAGMVLWRPGELSEELRRGLWYVQDATADIILRKPTDTMWEELVGRSERKANAT